MAKNDEQELYKWDDLPENIQKFLKKGFPFFKEPKFLSKKWINHFISHLIVYTDLREALQEAIDQKNATLDALNIDDLLALLQTAADQWIAAGEQWDNAAEQWDNAADQWTAAADGWEEYIKDLRDLSQELDEEQSLAMGKLESAFSDFSDNLNSILSDQESYSWYDPSSLTRTIKIRVTTPTDGDTTGSFGLQLNRGAGAIALRTARFGSTYTYEEPIYDSTGALYTYTVEVQANGRTEGYSYAVSGDMYSGFTITVDNLYDSCTITVTGSDNAVSWTLTDDAQTITYTGTADADNPADVELPQVWRGVALTGWTLTAEAAEELDPGYGLTVAGDAAAGWVINILYYTVYAFGCSDTQTLYFYSSADGPYAVGDEVNHDGDVLTVDASYTVSTTGYLDAPQWCKDGWRYVVVITPIISDTLTSLEMFFAYSSDLIAVDLSGLDCQNVENIARTFYDSTKLQTVSLAGCDLSMVQSLSELCYFDINLTSIDLSGCNLRAVTTMYHAFEDCEALERVVGAGDMDLQNCYNFESAFNACDALTELDISGWSAAPSGANYNYFARGAARLTTIFASDGMDLNVGGASGTSMFNGCIGLVGGAGTTYDPINGIGVGYAHIDGGEENPGYFTLKE